MVVVLDSFIIIFFLVIKIKVWFILVGGESLEVSELESEGGRRSGEERRFLCVSVCCF